jgi:thiamine biosynthesis protein ThiC
VREDGQSPKEILGIALVEHLQDKVCASRFSAAAPDVRKEQGLATESKIGLSLSAQAISTGTEMDQALIPRMCNFSGLK